MSFRLDLDPSLLGALKEMPPFVREVLVRGGELLPATNKDQVAEMVRVASEAAAGSYGAPNLKDVATKTGITEVDLRSLVSLITVIFTSVVGHDENPDTIVRVLNESGIAAEPAQKTALLELATTLRAKRSTYKPEVERKLLGTVVLPSLTSFRTATDLRVEIAEGTVKTAVPILVAYLNTDSSGQKVWFQMTKAQAERLLSDLQIAISEMDALDEWSKGKS